MPRFLLEVPHEAEPQACLLALKLLLSTGSHYLTQADFGCFDGEHKGWITVEAENKAEARCVLPPVYRAQAKVVQVDKFTLEEVDRLIQQHKG
jgi:hypothetical protein